MESKKANENELTDESLEMVSGGETCDVIFYDHTMFNEKYWYCNSCRHSFDDESSDFNEYGKRICPKCKSINITGVYK